MWGLSRDPVSFAVRVSSRLYDSSDMGMGTHELPSGLAVTPDFDDRSKLSPVFVLLHLVH